MVIQFRKAKSYYNNHWVALVKDGWGLLSYGTQKSADESSWFCACWYKFRKDKNYLNSFWVVVVKNEYGLLGHGTLKSAVPQELFDELSRFVCILIQIYET